MFPLVGLCVFPKYIGDSELSEVPRIIGALPFLAITIQPVHNFLNFVQAVAGPAVLGGYRGYSGACGFPHQPRTFADIIGIKGPVG